MIKRNGIFTNGKQYSFNNVDWKVTNIFKYNINSFFFYKGYFLAATSNGLYISKNGYEFDTVYFEGEEIDKAVLYQNQVIILRNNQIYISVISDSMSFETYSSLSYSDTVNDIDCYGERIVLAVEKNNSLQPSRVVGERVFLLSGKGGATEDIIYQDTDKNWFINSVALENIKIETIKKAGDTCFAITTSKELYFIENFNTSYFFVKINVSGVNDVYYFGNTYFLVANGKTYKSDDKKSWTRTEINSDIKNENYITYSSEPDGSKFCTSSICLSDGLNNEIIESNFASGYDYVIYFQDNNKYYAVLIDGSLVDSKIIKSENEVFCLYASNGSKVYIYESEDFHNWTYLLNPTISGNFIVVKKNNHLFIITAASKYYQFDETYFKEITQAELIPDDLILENNGYYYLTGANAINSTTNFYTNVRYSTDKTKDIKDWTEISTPNTETTKLFYFNGSLWCGTSDGYFGKLEGGTFNYKSLSDYIGSGVYITDGFSSKNFAVFTTNVIYRNDNTYYIKTSGTAMAPRTILIDKDDKFYFRGDLIIYNKIADAFITNQGITTDFINFDKLPDFTIKAFNYSSFELIKTNCLYEPRENLGKIKKEAKTLSVSRESEWSPSLQLSSSDFSTFNSRNITEIDGDIYYVVYVNSSGTTAGSYIFRNNTKSDVSLSTDSNYYTSEVFGNYIIFRQELSSNNYIFDYKNNTLVSLENSTNVGFCYVDSFGRLITNKYIYNKNLEKLYYIGLAKMDAVSEENGKYYYFKDITSSERTIYATYDFKNTVGSFDVSQSSATSVALKAFGGNCYSFWTDTSSTYLYAYYNTNNIISYEEYKPYNIFEKNKLLFVASRYGASGTTLQTCLKYVSKNKMLYTFQGFTAAACPYVYNTPTIIYCVDYGGSSSGYSLTSYSYDGIFWKNGSWSNTGTISKVFESSKDKLWLLDSDNKLRYLNLPEIPDGWKVIDQGENYITIEEE